MLDLSTSYMGLKLKNPIIVASSDLTRTAEGMIRCEEAGAGAIVLKSIFEEQFLIEDGGSLGAYSIHPEALDYLRSGGLLEYAPDKICREIEKSKKSIKIPVIASINCQTFTLWPRFARQIEQAGADGLELNIYDLPIDPEISGQEHDKRYEKILAVIKKEITIPVSIKLAPQVSSLAYLGRKLAKAGCNALVFFNWFLEPDIDIRKLKTYNRKGTGNFNQTLRWVALLSGRLGVDIVSSGGIRNFEDVVKQLLAGASAVQICTLFYKAGLTEIEKLLKGLIAWMKEHRYGSVTDFQGALSFKKQELSFKDLGESQSFFRAQYLKTYSK